MNDDQRVFDHSDPWDRGIYQTGSVEPVKKPSGAVGLLLVLVVILMGVIAILSVMNIRLFKTISRSKAQLSISTQPSVEVSLPTAITDSSEKEVAFDLEQAPTQDDPEGRLSLQQIYAQSIDSVVSIICHDSSGTGVVISQKGYIVTNCHVVEGARQILVQLSDGRKLQAALVGQDEASDLAVLWIEAEDLKAARFGDSDSVKVGDAVCAIGDPLGVELRGTMTDGIISAINRDITTGGRTMTLLQTNAALNSGNSGGPLINSYGQVIGINTMKIGDYMSVNGVEGLGFAIPSTTVKSIVDQLIAQGYVSGRPSLGILGEAVSELYQYYYRLPEGLFLTSVIPGSDAEAKGLMTGDILITLDGQPVPDPETLTGILYDCEVGDTLHAVIFRNNRQYTVDLTVEEAKG